MKIDSSMVRMDSAREYRAASVTFRRFSIGQATQEAAGGNTGLNTAVGGNTGNTENAQDSETNKTQQPAAELQDWQGRLQMASSNVTIRDSVSQALTELRETTIRYIFDILFSNRRNRMKPWMQGNGYSENTSQGASQNLLTNQQRTPAANVKVLNYSEDRLQIESEDTAFSTVGTVRTADGREINFNVNVGMSRQFQQHFQEDLQISSFKMCDPLVMNLNTDVAQLSDQTFYFDIDGDGEKDKISQLGSGSGYLALDKNGDGRINDGSELFGTASGNGFADLAEYDEDGNGWIDENDAVWDKLKIWCKDENGNDVLYKLADKGVGAICLQNVSTEHTLKGQSGQTKGAIRNTGIFLYENGNVGTVQHVDVAKYDSQA